MTLPQDFIGVDIAKGWIDVFYLIPSKHERIVTTKQSLARFSKAAAGCLVVCEASGGYERPLTEALAKAGVDYARVNPRQPREFARTTGRLAKTDRVDAMVLAQMGRALELQPTPPPDPGRARLADLVARRDDLVGMIGAEKNRKGTTGDGWIGKEIALLINALQSHLAAIEGQITILIKARAPLARITARLCSVPGIGPTLSAVLIARLPELGQMEPRKITSLAALAPHTCESGLSRGKRRIWGGRADVRRALYILRGAYAAPLGPRSPPHIHRQPIRSHDESLPSPPAKHGKARQTRPHRLRKKAAHNPKRDGKKRSELCETERLKDSCYGVEYDPSWRNQAGAAKTKRTGKVLNDDRADWRVAWALFTDGIAHISHGALHVTNVAESLLAAGLAVRTPFIRAKDPQMLSRSDLRSSRTLRCPT